MVPTGASAAPVRWLQPDRSRHASRGSRASPCALRPHCGCALLLRHSALARYALQPHRNRVVCIAGEARKVP